MHPSSNHLPFKAIFFDMDETLIRHRKNFEEVAAETFAQFAGQLEPITPLEFWSTWWPKAQDLWYMMFDGVIDGETARRYAYINTLRTLKADESLAEAMMHAGEQTLIEAAHLVEDARDVLLALREAGIRTGLVTNGFSVTQRKKVAHHQLEEQLDFVLVSEEVGSHKPHPHIFEEALRRADVTADEALFVGDMPANDIKGALGAGMKAALIDFGGAWEDMRETDGMPDPTYRIHTLREVLRLAGLEDGAA